MQYGRVTILAVFVVVVVAAGAAVGTTILVPSEQPTIQQGIDAAVAGDVVQVAAGTYTGVLNRDLDFGGVNITLESESGAGATVIDCESAGRGFFFHSGEDTTSVIRGFTISSAVADSGAGAYCISGSSPRFEECTFTDCVAVLRGGGLCCDASSPVARDCEFVQNMVTGSGRSSGYGGGMSCLSGSAPLITGTEFRYNYAQQGGGGLFSRDSSLQVGQCLFLENTGASYAAGGGARLINSDGTTFTDCEFRANGVYDGVGGGLHSAGSDVTVEDCLFIDNISGAAGGIHFSQATSSTVTGCTFIRNSGSWSAAGAIKCYSEAAPVISNCTFVANSKHQVWCDEASPTLEYCIFALSPNGSPVLCENPTAIPSVHHCFVFENVGGDTLCGDYHDIEYADPLFCDIDSDDLTLCADSPCLPGVTWAELVGAEGAGCAACGSAVEQRTWGVIKAMYR